MELEHERKLFRETLEHQYQTIFLNAFPFQNQEVQIDKTLLLDMLNRLCNAVNNKQEYDLEIALELFNRIENDENKPITIKNFIQVHIDAQDILQLKLNHMEQFFKTTQQHIQQLDELLQELTHSYQPQSFPAKNNILLIDSIVVSNLYLKTSNNQFKFEPFVVIKVDNFLKDVQDFVQSGSSYFFNPKFQVPLQSLISNIEIKVFDKKPQQLNGDNIEYGFLEVQLDSLEFNKKDIYKYKLISNNTGASDMELSLQAMLQINNYHSAINQLNEKYKKSQEILLQCQEEKKIYQEQLEILLMPFQVTPGQIKQLQQSGHQNYQNINKSSIGNSALQQQQSPQIQEFQPGITNTVNSNRNMNDPSQSLATEQKFGQVGSQLEFDQFNSNFTMEMNQITPMNTNIYGQQQLNQNLFQQPQHQININTMNTPRLNISLQSTDQKPQINPVTLNNQLQNNNAENKSNEEDLFDCSQIFNEIRKYMKRGDYIHYIYLILASIVCFRRSTFVDLSISATFLICLNSRLLTTTRNLLLYFIIALAISISMDILWLIVYFQAWSGKNSQKVTTDFGQEEILLTISNIGSIVLIIYKGIAVLANYLILKRYPDHAIELQGIFCNSSNQQ